MATAADEERRFTGLPISPGIALGPVCLFRQSRHNVTASYTVQGKDIDREKDRLRQAGQVVADRLETLRETVAERLGQAEAEIFVAQKMMLMDPVLHQQMDGAICEGVNAETAVTQTLDDYETQLAQIDDEYLKERASDLGELRRRLLDVLCETSPSFKCSAQSTCVRGQDRIVITEELTPSLTLELESDDLLGFVTERGGVTSHAAILARAIGIPAVSGIAEIHDLVPCGTEVLLNGNTGEVVVRPAERTKALAAAQGRAGQVEPVEPVEALRVLANISTSVEARLADAMKAEGIGLYRTEFEFFAAGKTLDEDEQYRRYRHVVEAMAPRPVTFRMLDIGGDKPLAELGLPKEDNPSLGCRGARLLLARPELMRPQARALARASAGTTIHVMYPMVTGVGQFRRLREAFNEMTGDVDAGRILHGLMFEVPSACLDAAALFAEADFGSIGSNDLLQYVFAVDRNNGSVAGDYSPDHEVFWRLVSEMASAASAARKPLSLCGELAADVTYTPRLLASGLRTVSVSPRQISAVRQAADRWADEQSRCPSGPRVVRTEAASGARPLNTNPQTPA